MPLDVNTHTCSVRIVYGPIFFSFVHFLSIRKKKKKNRMRMTEWKPQIAWIEARIERQQQQQRQQEEDDVDEIEK